MAIKGLVEHVNRRSCPYGDPPYFHAGDFPWIPAIESRFEAIREEFHRVWEAGLVPDLEALHPGARSLSIHGKWKMFPFYHFGVPLQPMLERCPATAEALQLLPGIGDASFSILPPGAALIPHRGRYNGLIRYHLGLVVPPDDSCAIRVDGLTRHWADGRSLLFNDAHTHEAWNRGDALRVILNTTFQRPLRRPAETLNRLAVRGLAWKDGVAKGARKVRLRT